MKNESEVPIPDTMKKLKLWNGFPIMHTVKVDKGVPDFRVVDEDKISVCFHRCMCGICGQKLVGEAAFIGNQWAIDNGFCDPGMHVECAEYAAKVCPYLAGTKRLRLKVETKTEKKGCPIVKVNDVRPDRLALVVAGGFQLFSSEEGQLLAKATKIKRVDWDIMPPSEKIND